MRKPRETKKTYQKPELKKIHDLLRDKKGHIRDVYAGCAGPGAGGCVCSCTS